MKTYKDIYKFPLKQGDYCSWVWDNNEGNFVFQFLIKDKEDRKKLLEVINGERNLKDKEVIFQHKGGYITESNTKVDIILIRGWGGLTGTGGHNLSGEEAANIQDTFADYIVERLNFRK